MKVILLDNIKGVGYKDQIIDANDGYARNFLIPKGKAVEANTANLAKLKAKQDSNAYKKSRREWKNLWWCYIKRNFRTIKSSIQTRR